MILSPIKNALGRDEVEWGQCSSWIYESTGHFKWAGCEWKIIEIQESVRSVELLSGTLDDPDLTVIVLRG